MCVLHMVKKSIHRCILQDVLQCVAVCCGAMWCVAVRCSALQCVAVYYKILHTRFRVLICSVLQPCALPCVAVFCRVLQCVAVSHTTRNAARVRLCACDTQRSRAHNEVLYNAHRYIHISVDIDIYTIYLYGTLQHTETETYIQKYTYQCIFIQRNIWRSREHTDV